MEQEIILFSLHHLQISGGIWLLYFIIPRFRLTRDEQNSYFTLLYSYHSTKNLDCKLLVWRVERKELSDAVRDKGCWGAVKTFIKSFVKRLWKRFLCIIQYACRLVFSSLNPFDFFPYGLTLCSSVFQLIYKPDSISLSVYPKSSYLNTQLQV